MCLLSSPVLVDNLKLVVSGTEPRGVHLTVGRFWVPALVVRGGTCKNCCEVTLCLKVFVGHELSLPHVAVKMWSTFCEEVLKGQEWKMGFPDSVFHFKTKPPLWW